MSTDTDKFVKLKKLSNFLSDNLKDKFELANRMFVARKLYITTIMTGI